MGESRLQVIHYCFNGQLVPDAYEHTIAESANHATDGQRR